MWNFCNLLLWCIHCSDFDRMADRTITRHFALFSPPSSFSSGIVAECSKQSKASLNIDEDIQAEIAGIHATLSDACPADYVIHCHVVSKICSRQKVRSYIPVFMLFLLTIFWKFGSNLDEMWLKKHNVWRGSFVK